MNVSFPTKLRTAIEEIQTNARIRGILYGIFGLLILTGFAFTFQNISNTAVGITLLVIGSINLLALFLISWLTPEN